MKKNIIIIASVIIVLIATSCKENNSKIDIYGLAQGTYYNISYYDENNKNLNKEIDSILKDFDMSLSTYKENSIISKFNDSDSGCYVNDLIINVFNKSVEISEKTNGAFDCTIAPIVNLWGFGKDTTIVIDSNLIKEKLKYVNYKNITLKGKFLYKPDKNIRLDFNAIAQGYSVDIISKFLESKNIMNYIVDIGGEVYAKGVKKNNEKWTVGIENPNGGNNLISVVTLENRSIATSGNYRKYRIVNGKKFAHTISPKTGMPVQHSLLSASVFAKDAITADAYATAFMVLGFEESLKIIEKNKEIDVFFIYADSLNSTQIYYTDWVKNCLVNK